MWPYHDKRQIGGTRSMRFLLEAFGEFERHAPPTRGRRWPKSLSAVAIVNMGRRL